jgi:hypothetical protein
MKVHTFRKNPKGSEQMKAHNIIHGFVPSKLIFAGRTFKNPKMNKFQEQIKDYFKIQLGGEHLSYHNKYHYF